MPPQPSYLPTPEEIALATAKIRNHWSERTYRERAGLSPKREPYTIPKYKFTINRSDQLVAERLE